MGSDGTGSGVRSVDRRTRVDGARVDVDPDRFLGADLPEALAAAAPRLGPALAFLALRPLRVEAGGRAWELAVDDGRPSVVPVSGAVGDDDGPGGAVSLLRVTGEQLTDLVHDLVTPIAWMIDGSLDLTRGHLDGLLDWWLVIRAALDGTTPHVPGDVELTDRTGRPLDLGRSFGPDDDLDEIGDFLAAAGFVHLRGVFTEAEMAEVSADMDRAAPRYAKGDGRSWWAEVDGGTERLVRMQSFDEESDAVARLVADPRLARLGGLTGDGHAYDTTDWNRIEALFKPIGVVQGISDVPWHKDCSIGRHSYTCSSLTIGISVTGADAVSGRLKVVAGSHRALVWPSPVLQPGLDLPVVDLETETGDVTIHLSCTLHMAQPPTERERRVLYTSLILPPLDPAAHAAARRRLRAHREAAPTTVSQPSATG
jgi:hypothetical protein